MPARVDRGLVVARRVGFDELGDRLQQPRLLGFAEAQDLAHTSRMHFRVGLMLLALGAPVMAQTPQPFPRPNAPQPAPPRPETPTRSGQPAKPASPVTPPAAVDPNAPTEEMLGFVIYPAAQFIASYDAGRGQRFFLFGAAASFTELVNFYRS